MAPKDTPTTGTTEDTSATGSDLKAIADTQPDVTTNTRVSQYALDPTMKLQARKIQQPDPKDRNLPGLAAAGMFRAEKYAPADRLERLLPSYKEWIYTGQNLVDEEGKIVGPAYNVETAPLMELARMPATQRMAFLRMLESRGLYGGSKISKTGTDSADVGAMQQYLLAANIAGRTITAYQPQFLLEYKGGQGGSGQKIRYTPKQDVRANFKQVFLSDVGRGATEAEIAKFEAAYRGMESASGTTQSAPSVSAAAVESIGMNNKAEEQANGFLQVAQTFERLLRG